MNGKQQAMIVCNWHHCSVIGDFPLALCVSLVLSVTELFWCKVTEKVQ